MTREVTITNERGMHGRPCGLFSQLARTFSCDVSVNGADGKSLTALLELRAECGTALTIYCDGVDSEAAACSLGDLVARGFGEPA